MTQRIVFEFLQRPDCEPKKWAVIKKIILDAEGTYLSEPAGDPPYILTAVLPDESRAREVVALLRLTDGVGRADLDAMRKAF